MSRYAPKPTRMTSKTNSKRKSIVAATGISLLLLFFVFLVLNWLMPFKVNLEFSQVVRASDGKILNAYLTNDDKWRMKVESTELTEELKEAFLFKEDQHFYRHPGVNPLAILRALANNLFFAKRTSGASTITMQLARLLEPRPRTYRSKLVEAFRALQLEWNYSKEEILLYYLSLVPYGGNIEGVKSAAVLFLEKSPELLSTAEIAALTVIPNRPGSLALGKHNDRVVASRDQWLRRYHKAGLFSDELLQDAINEPLKASRKNAPGFAPHFSRRIRKQSNEPNIYTSLDFNKQKEIERIVMQYVEGIRRKRISNAAVLVIDNKSMQVLSYVGSADFYNVLDAGQVDGITAVRSPGSTLKPLLYAMAFDEGLITPKQRLLDVRTDFGDYSPQNFDRVFNGTITAEDALASSLNVPAVRLANKLGLTRYLETLISADFKTIDQQREKLGLSIVLGGCGASLQELVGLYASFANRGRYRDLHWFPEDSLNVERQLLSPSAAFFLNDVLAKLGRPDLPQNFSNSKHLPKVAWKTGTSYGRRDAWSIGFNQNYTVGVWCGNFSAKGVKELTGTDIATPLLFKIFNSIDYDSSADWYLPSEEMKYRWVCSETGLPAGDHCEDQIMDYFVPLVSPNNRCKHLQTVFLSADEKSSYCRSCLPQLGYKEALMPTYPPALITYFERNLISYHRIPPHNPECERIFGGKGPVVISPNAGSEYLIDRSLNDEMLLQSHIPNDVEIVYWYANGRFLQAVQAQERLFFKPIPGKNRVTCVDDKGRRAEAVFTVQYL